jgi:hypothetical protein
VKAPAPTRQGPLAGHNPRLTAFFDRGQTSSVGLRDPTRGDHFRGVCCTASLVARVRECTTDGYEGLLSWDKFTRCLALRHVPQNLNLVLWRPAGDGQGQIFAPRMSVAGSGTVRVVSFTIVDGDWATAADQVRFTSKKVRSVVPARAGRAEEDWRLHSRIVRHSGGVPSPPHKQVQVLPFIPLVQSPSSTPYSRADPSARSATMSAAFC